MLADIQAASDTRGIPLEEVGVQGLRYPVLVADGQGAKRETVATVTMSVSLGPQARGAHLSRFVEVLHDSREQVSPQTVLSLADEVQARMGAARARVEMSFPYFLERTAPVTGALAFVEYRCALTAVSRGASGTVTTLVEVPVTSVCPCSKAISDRGAHNQRGWITIEVDSADLGFDELIGIAEQAASSPVYALLKRPDERHVTMAGYDNPVFVEDMVRNVAQALEGMSLAQSYRVRAVNDESIHNHAAYAEVSRLRTSGED